MDNRFSLRNLPLILLGILILLVKRHYRGPGEELVYSYATNFSVSFSVYFIALLGLDFLPHPRWPALFSALLAVELFELTNGFGVMTNVYDPWDLLANGLGIGLAVLIDLILSRTKRGGNQTNGSLD